MKSLVVSGRCEAGFSSFHEANLYNGRDVQQALALMALRFIRIVSVKGGQFPERRKNDWRITGAARSILMQREPGNGFLISLGLLFARSVHLANNNPKGKELDGTVSLKG